MRLLVVGATGRLGRVTVDAALRRGHDVTALVRDPLGAQLPGTVRLVRGNVLDPASFPAAMPGRDAVIWTLGSCAGSTVLSDGTRNLVAAMTAAHVARLVCVSALGTAGSMTHASLLYRWRSARVLAPVLPDREQQEFLIRDSGLDWVIVRPPRLVGGAARRTRVLREADEGRVGHVTRRGLAAFLLEAAEQPGYVRRALVVGS